jgi:hypothetical protein
VELGRSRQTIPLTCTGIGIFWGCNPSIWRKEYASDPWVYKAGQGLINFSRHLWYKRVEFSFSFQKITLSTDIVLFDTQLQTFEVRVGSTRGKVPTDLSFYHLCTYPKPSTNLEVKSLNRHRESSSSTFSGAFFAAWSQTQLSEEFTHDTPELWRVSTDPTVESRCLNLRQRLTEMDVSTYIFAVVNRRLILLGSCSAADAEKRSYDVAIEIDFIG